MAVFKDELHGKKIKVEAKEGVLDHEVDFEDDGIRASPAGHWNLFSKRQKVPSKLYKENYDKIKWNRKEKNDS